MMTWCLLRRWSRKLNAKTGGNPEHCFSTRVYAEDRRVLIVIIDIVFLPWGFNHCYYSWQREVQDNAPRSTTTETGDNGVRVVR